MICDKCGIHFGNGIMMSSIWKDGEINLFKNHHSFLNPSSRCEACRKEKEKEK